MTLGEWLAQARGRVTLLEAQVLAGHALNRDRAWVVAHPEAEVPDLALEAMLQRLEAAEPLAYVTGHREFFGLDFYVSPAVLIPRQETETLVQAVLDEARVGATVLDIGTGSGCIAISLKHSRPDLVVSAVDISAPALEVARRNAGRNGVEIAFFEGDGIELLSDHAFDVIATNPPYVADGDSLGRGVAEYEPHAALFAGETGLEFYRRLAPAVGQATLYTEVGDSQAEAVRALFDAEGLTVEGYRDLLGTTRVLRATRPGG